MTLRDLPTGSEARVREILGARSLRRRLEGMGIHPGDRVEVVQAAVRGGATLIQVHGAEVALGHEHADLVIVDAPVPA